jgi:exonuclease VII small subunit
LKAAKTKADGFNKQVTELNTQINFITAKEIDTSSKQGKKAIAALEKARKDLEKVTTKANSANTFV